MDNDVSSSLSNNTDGASELKSRATAGVLGITLGCFGAHNFYLGYKSKAITQLVITIVGFVLCCVIIGIIPLFGVCIWTIIESIMIFSGKINVDADGRPLAD